MVYPCDCFVEVALCTPLFAEGLPAWAMNKMRTQHSQVHKLVKAAAVVAAVLPSLVQAFIPQVSNYNAGLDLAIAKTGTVSVAQAQENPAYNAKGEPLSDSRFRYVFNAFGWLTSVTNLVAEPAGYVAFAYDTGGRRVRKTVYERNGSVWHGFFQ